MFDVLPNQTVSYREFTDALALVAGEVNDGIDVFVPNETVISSYLSLSQVIGA
jgi:hypothetical protein